MKVPAIRPLIGAISTGRLSRFRVQSWADRMTLHGTKRPPVDSLLDCCVDRLRSQHIRACQVSEIRSQRTAAKCHERSYDLLRFEP